MFRHSAMVVEDQPDEAALARLRHALTVVQHDLDATGIAERLTLAHYDDAGWRITFASSQSYRHDAPISGDTEIEALWTAAGNAQDLIADLLFRAWPLCLDHGFGLLLWSAGAGSDWSPDDPQWSTPAWRFLSAAGHEVALVGQLHR